jgi:dTDP-4-dehydrorhamnose reductase
MKKVLILGSKGMLGQELVYVLEKDENYEIIGWDREEINVMNFEELRNRINDMWPDIIYNAVAYNAVDACEESEEEYQKAKKLNGEYPGELAKIAKKLDAILVHYSTDYVFDGKRPKYPEGKNPGCCGSGCPGCMYKGAEETLDYYAYHEDDVPRPISRYGRTKLQGEREVAKHAKDHYIIRLSKLFGKPAKSESGKKSFFDIMLDLGVKSDTVKAVDGEMSKFTYAPDLARTSKEIVENKLSNGIYHVANEGAATWYDGAVALFKIAKLSTEVTSVPPEEFPRAADRPTSSVLKVTKIKNLRHYTDALEEYLTQRGK